MKVSAKKSGRAWNGFHMDAGKVIHSVEEMPSNMGGYWGDSALCGAKPGKRSNGWELVKETVTCPKCIKKLKQI